MGRYVKKFGRVGYALGPSEEPGFALWAGYDIVGVEDDLSAYGLLKAEDGAEHGVEQFAPVEPDDVAMYEKLGIPRRR